MGAEALKVLSLDGVCAACWFTSNRDILELALATTKPKPILPDKLCPECGDTFGSERSERVAEAISRSVAKHAPSLAIEGRGR